MRFVTRFTRSRSVDDSRVCESSGLQLKLVSGQPVWRIAKTSYGAMNPPLRSVADDRRAWGRFDVAGQQVIYGAEPEDAAYAECLACFRVAETFGHTSLGDVFSDEMEDGTLLEQVQAEWEEQHHMGPGHMPAGWRLDRLIYELRLPENGWVVDICHSESVSAIDRSLRELLDSLGVSSLTVAHLLGEDRELTTQISEWIWALVLDDGSLPHGIMFPSKHGDEFTCVALYLRAVGDGKPLSAEPTKSDRGSEIYLPERNPALHTIATKFGLHCF